MARVYSLWIFDRHCNPIYHQDWSHLHAASSSSPPISAGAGPASPTSSQTSGFASIGATIQRATSSTNVVPPEAQAPPPRRPGQPSLPNVTRIGSVSTSSQPDLPHPQGARQHDQRSSSGSQYASAPQPAQPELLPFDEEAKLVYGVVFSLRNMVRKLGGDSESFNSFTTSTYTLAHLHTPTMYTFVILTDPVPPPSSIPARSSEGYSIGAASSALAGRSSFGAGGGIPGTGGMSLKGVLLQIYRGPWVDNVVRNPLINALDRIDRDVEPVKDIDLADGAPPIKVQKEGKVDRLEGIDTDAFRDGIEKVLTQNKLAAPTS